MPAFRSTPGIDATKKIPGEGFKRPWPPLIKVDENVRKKVNWVHLETVGVVGQPPPAVLSLAGALARSSTGEGACRDEWPARAPAPLLTNGVEMHPGELTVRKCR